MLANPDNADPGPADVFSLAKTLWVLATNQRYPPQGEHRSSYHGMNISDFLADDQAPPLDSLIQRCTIFNPKARPSMSEFKEELGSWLNPESQNTGVSAGNLRTIGERFATIREPQAQAQVGSKARADMLDSLRELKIARVRELTNICKINFNGSVIADENSTIVQNCDRSHYLSLINPEILSSHDARFWTFQIGASCKLLISNRKLQVNLIGQAGGFDFRSSSKATAFALFLIEFVDTERYPKVRKTMEDRRICIVHREVRISHCPSISYSNAFHSVFGNWDKAFLKAAEEFTKCCEHVFYRGEAGFRELENKYKD